MISMKIDVKEDKIIVYLYKYKLSFDNLEKLTNDIKNIFVKLIKVYNVDLHGYLKVLLYCNKIYGYVLEIESLYTDYDFETIDLKLVIYDNCEFYFKTNNYFIVEGIDKVYYNNGAFYVNLKLLNDLINVIEHGEIIYDFDKSKCKLL